MRLNKFISASGYCSRRQADELIKGGKVEVNGQPADLGSQVTENDRVKVEGRYLCRQERMVLACYKPTGIICTTAEQEQPNVMQYFGFSKGLYPVGRLDKDSEGLLLMTNDGDLMNYILKARHFHEKEYIVEVDSPITAEFIQRMEDGVEILDTVTRPCRVKKMGKRRFSIILTQGLNRQIRRMCEALGYRVTRLKRIRIMNITLDLPTGGWRELTAAEIRGLQGETDERSSQNSGIDNKIKSGSPRLLY
ncbi:MAG: pseudouridine synthase [Lachnospiraceae bacterium]|nr:pseudouridine synthase [Lachnospiraceae bacterium]MDY5741525.1 pseudouridine synthase [Lachnospiraceae bacterium]